MKGTLKAVAFGIAGLTLALLLSLGAFSQAGRSLGEYPTAIFVPGGSAGDVAVASPSPRAHTSTSQHQEGTGSDGTTALSERSPASEDHSGEGSGGPGSTGPGSGGGSDSSGPGGGGSDDPPGDDHGGDDD